MVASGKPSAEMKRKTSFPFAFRSLNRTLNYVLRYSRSENCKFICIFARLIVPLSPNFYYMKRFFLFAIAAVALSACQQNKFKVEGCIENAKDSMLFLQNVSLKGLVTVDSVKLGEDGTFTLKGDATDSPEFYILRIHNQIINLCIDSTETVNVKAKWPTMAAEYDVEGSDNCQKIKELSLMQQDLQRCSIALEKDFSLSRAEAEDSLARMLQQYKEQVTVNYIYQGPNKPYAYFALFQTLGPWLIFDPKNDAADLKVFAAVATSWDTYYPESERSENLHNITIEGMKNKRIVDARQQQRLNNTQIVEANVIDLAYNDNRGKERTLTELKGKVVLLDFHTFTLQDSPQRILMLRELYNKYHEQGLEIYQVSLDQDEHFWRQMTAQLPWICVRDTEGQSLMRYNVRELPEFFLIDRQNQLQKRGSQVKNLEEEIEKLLSFRAD